MSKGSKRQKLRQKPVSKDIKDPTAKDVGSKKTGNNGKEKEAVVNKAVVHAEGAIGNEEDMNDDMNAEQVDGGGELAQEFEAEAYICMPTFRITS